MNNLPTAFFVEYPFRIEDLIKPHSPNQQKPYIVEKVIRLGKIDYENFITDLCVDRLLQNPSAALQETPLHYLKRYVLKEMGIGVYSKNKTFILPMGMAS